MTSQPTFPAQEPREFSVEELQAQVNRIAGSAMFEHSQTLQRLFRYLAAKSIETPGDPIKEYTIGVEVLERTSSFDPRIDTIVRVQIHRLREKLQEYYKTEGLRDPISVSIPKGRYLPSFSAVRTRLASPQPEEAEPARALTQLVASAEEIESNREGPTELRPRFVRHALLIIGVSMIAITCFFAGFYLGPQWLGRPSGEEQTRLSVMLPMTDPVRGFWTALLGTDSAPIIVFPNPVYLLDSSNDLFSYSRGAVDHRGASVDPNLARKYAPNASLIGKTQDLYYENGYTGTGDLKGVAILVGLLTKMGLTPTVKLGSELTSEDLQQHNVIALGSSFQGIAAAQLAPNGGLVFDWSMQPGAWREQILNLYPQANERSIYRTERDPVTNVLRADHSIVSVQPGIARGRYIVILAGLDTTGTEGAALFITSKTGIEGILGSSAVLAEDVRQNRAPLFQALLRVPLANGSEVLSSDLVTFRLPKKEQSSPISPLRDKLGK